MLIDQTKLHTMTVLTCTGPMKQFPTKDGVRERFDIVFKEGYKAEFCPLVAEVSQIPISGQTITFKVKHRGNKGDEIELAAVEGQRSPVDSSNTGRYVSMNGHPANIALSGALRAAELKKTEENPIVLSDILDDADSIYDWLLRKAEGN